MMIDRQEKAQEARRLFTEEGYNCSQSVAIAYAGEMGLTKEAVSRMMGGFGAGFGRMREVCGTVSGMTFVLGMLYGSENPKDREKKTALYEAVQEVGGRFREQNGSLICRELLSGCRVTGGAVPEERNTEAYKKRPCPLLAADAAGYLADYINAHPLG